MFKFLVLCIAAVLAVVSAKPSLLAYSAAPVIAASPYAAYSSAYVAPYYAGYTAYASPYVSPYAAYPYASVYLRR